MQRFFYIDNFRALAIISIVVGHCSGFLYLKYEESNLILEKILLNIIQGGTFFFVFITGYLTSKIFYKKYEFKEFIYKKISQLLPPYLILSLPIFFLYLILNKGCYKEESIYNQILIYIFSGQTFCAYWYIPFAILLFCLYPMLKELDKHPKQLYLFTFILSILALYIQRPVNNINVFQSLIYFLPIYLLGNIFSKKELFILKKSQLLLPLSLVGFLLSLLLQSFFSENIGSFHSYTFQFNGIDYMYLQKLFLIVFTFITFHKFFNYQNKFLNIFTRNSFGIFFVHMPVLYILGYIKNLANIESSFYLYIFICIFSLLISLIFIKVTKLIFKEKSKYFIGV